MINFSEIRERAGYKVSSAEKDVIITSAGLEEQCEAHQAPNPAHFFNGFDMARATKELQERLGAVIADFPTAKDDTVISFLLDSRGGMRGWPLVTFAGISGWLTKELDALGIKHEILSHTTNEWKASLEHSARMRAEREATGTQIPPGRVGSLLHVIWKEVDGTAPDLALQFLKLGHTGFLKDNVDGEAVEWAYNRIVARPEPSKLLFTVKSIGLSPISQATEVYNGADINLLHRHLLHTVNAINEEGDVQLSAVVLEKSSSPGLFDERYGIADDDVIAAYGEIYSSTTNEWDEIADTLIEAISTSMRQSLELNASRTPSM